MTLKLCPHINREAPQNYGASLAARSYAICETGKCVRNRSIMRSCEKSFANMALSWVVFAKTAMASKEG